VSMKFQAQTHLTGGGASIVAYDDERFLGFVTIDEEPEGTIRVRVRTDESLATGAEMFHERTREAAPGVRGD
jgi:hypothetical protein